METELTKIILTIPFDIYKSRYYVSNSIDTYRNIWSIYYKRRSKKSQYIVRVQKLNDNSIPVVIDVDIDAYPLRIEHAPKYLIKIITRIASYLSILGFPTRVYGL